MFRLNGELKEKGNWKPEVHYKLSLNEIKNQFTPAEEYRYKLATSGKIERALRKLEKLWNLNFDGWTNAAVKVQAAYRGLKGRRFFLSVKPRLEILREHRYAKIAVLKACESGVAPEALEILSTVREISPELSLMQAKIAYTLKEYHVCETAARRILDAEGWKHDARYLLSCSLASRSEFPLCLEELNVLVNQDDLREDIKDDAYKLRAAVYAKVVPPRFDQAVLDLDYLLTENPQDLNLFLQRACACACLQDWDRVVADLTVVLSFQPNLSHALAIRARAYCCRREWVLARQDYGKILESNTNSIVALQGLADIAEPLPEDEVPMLDATLLN